MLPGFFIDSLPNHRLPVLPGGFFSAFLIKAGEFKIQSADRNQYFPEGKKERTHEGDKASREYQFGYENLTGKYEKHADDAQKKA